LGHIRQWLIGEAKIIASLDLDSDTFQPHTGVQTSVLILQKKTVAEKTEEQRTRTLHPYNIFMAVIDKVGHDKRGNNIYQRDEHGEEILVEVDETIAELDKTASGQTTVKSAKRLEKVSDDQTRAVPAVFGEWKRSEGIAW
jgi:type I restriction enzyme M protein